MSHSEEILKLIETADPTDSAKLDEIDARVWIYLSLEAHIFLNGSDEQNIAFIRDGITKHLGIKYTRSRDALKTIRPDGWDIQIIKGFEKDYFCELRCQKNGGWINTANVGDSFRNLPTEELAELHTIIQAIAYKRAQLKLKDE